MPDSPLASRPRWLRSGLRTMFVVLTVFSVWLGWQAKIVRDRREEIARLPNDRLGFAATPDLIALDVEAPTIPFGRRWLGDKAYAAISAPADYSDGEMDKLFRLFPEAVFITRYNE